MTRLRFDFPDAGRSGSVVFTDPARVVQADRLDEVEPALDAVREATDAGLHAAGFVAYEAAPALDPAMRTHPPGALPLVWFGLYDRPDDSDGPGDRRQPIGGSPSSASGDLVSVPWEIETTRSEHAARVRAIREAIAEGRTYQVNLTTRLRAPFRASPEALYHGLRRAQGGGYHALLEVGRWAIVSASPELFFETRGRTIATRPMKGTRPRGRWPEEDRALRAELESSDKDRAENLMIADLLRNDLGRVCVPGGVRVPALWEVERYRTVWQLTSTVTGTLRPDVGLVELFRALFPCGSVTGAPKISTMELITRLEPTPRGVYCGAIGWVRPGGDATFSVPIRTAVLDREHGEIVYGTGGGVVWDSSPEAEWDELMAKTAVVRNPWPAFRLLETLGLRDGEPVRLDRHVARMARSAERFELPFDADAVRAAVLLAARDRPGPRMLRVTVGREGDVALEEKPLDRVGAAGPDRPQDPPTPDGHDGPAAHHPDERPVVRIASSPIDPTDPFLYHKTTHRAVYQRHRDEAAGHVFDVLLWNPDGRVTEFCRGNLVVQLEGRLLTPARDAGLLPGCLREELLEAGQVTETDLTKRDVARAARVWFINSARGWVEVRLTTD